MVTAEVFGSPGSCLVTLTRREIEVFSLVLEGKSSKEAAALLFCSKRTIDCHLAKIYSKLQVTNRVQAMRRAAMLGILELGAGPTSRQPDAEVENRLDSRRMHYR